MHRLSGANNTFAERRASHVSCTPFSQLKSRHTGRFLPHIRNIRRATEAKRYCAARQQLSQCDTADQTWSLLQERKRSLAEAVAQESYVLAAKLRDEIKALALELPPVRQFVFQQLELLGTGSLDEKLHAVASLGSAGDSVALPALAQCLADSRLHDATSRAMYSIFEHCKNPVVVDMMREGYRLKNDPAQHERALEVFERVVALEPDYVEGYNQRATLLYLLHRYQESLEDCHRVLSMQPLHFNAQSGMGLCYIGLQDYASALEAFDKALQINPRLDQIRSYVRSLRSRIQGSGNSG